MLDPDRLEGHSAYELLQAGARGLIGLDQRWMHALIDEPAKTLPDIIRFASEDRSKDFMNLEEDLISIFQYLKAPEGVPYLVELLRENSEEVPDEIVEALAAIGQPALDPLLKLYEEIAPESRSDLAFLLAGLGVKDPRILNLLLAQLDEDLENGLFHLEVYGDPAAIPVLEERLARTSGEEDSLELRDTIRDLNKPSPQVEPEPFDIWELYPANASPNFELMDEVDRLEFLRHGNTAQRAEAAESYQGQEELSDKAKSALLEAARNDPDPLVRANCWASFFNATDDPEMREVLMGRLRDRETPLVERAGAALGLVFHTDQPLVYQTVLEAANNPETRARALETMWRSFNPDFIPFAEKFINDPDSEVRRQAIWMVGYLQIRNLAPELPKFFDDDALREDALHNYAAVYPGPLARARTLQLFKKIEDLAHGLSADETQWVEAGLDLRLVRGGSKAFFIAAEAASDAPVSVSEKVGRNEPCPCGSGKKYKKCCGL